MFGKSKKKECKKLDKAKDVASKYEQLSKCCEVLSGIQKPKEDDLMSLHRLYSNQGWRVWSHTVKGSGIDIEDVYEYIGKLALKRKLELECELSKLS